MLTAKVAEYDRVEGLDAGADDYISKPFGIMELIARVRAVLRRAEPAEAEDSEYKCGVLEIYWDRHEVYADGKEASLTFKEFELLRMLVEHAGIVLPREKLLDSIWGLGERENRTLDVHVRTLRAKLGEAGAYIQTVRGVGYKFAGETA